MESICLGTRRLLTPAAAAISVLVVSSGCASHIKYLCDKGTATTTIVNVRTDPPGALLELSTGRKTRTPASWSSGASRRSA